MRTGPRSLQDVLAQQREMMKAKRDQLDAIIRAIDKTEHLLGAGQCDWDSLTKVIQAIQMEQDRDWVKNYLTPEQMEQMQKLSEQSYSEEARQKLAARGEWSEADQQRVSAQWAQLSSDVSRLSAANTDPASPDAQDVAKRHSDLIASFTGGDRRNRERSEALVAEQRCPPYGSETCAIPIQQGRAGLAGEGAEHLQPGQSFELAARSSTDVQNLTSHYRNFRGRLGFAPCHSEGSVERQDLGLVSSSGLASAVRLHARTLTVSRCLWYNAGPRGVAQPGSAHRSGR